MITRLKTISLSIFIIFMLVISGAIVFLQTLDLNDYKTQLSTLLATNTGLDVTVQGPLQWSLTSSLALEAHDVQIRGPESQPSPMTAKYVRVYLRLRPLIQGKIEIRSIQVVDAHLHYHVTKQGRHNWFSKKPMQNKQAHPHPGHDLTIPQLSVVNAQLIAENLQTGQQLRVHQLNATGKFRYASTPGIGQLQLNGKVTTGPIHYQQLKIERLTASLHSKPGQVSFAPLQLNLYQGSTTVTGAITFNNGKVSAEFDETTQNLQLNQLFGDLGQLQPIHGRFSSQFHYLIQDLTSPVKTTHGLGKYRVDNGRLQGINITRIVETANALFHRTAQPKKNDEKDTPFTSMHGNVLLKDGQLYHTHLNMASPSLQISGKGQVNLRNQRVHYQLNARLTKLEKPSPLLQAQTFLGGSFPLRVTGTWSNYALTPDVSLITKQAAKYYLQRPLKDKLDQLLSPNETGKQKPFNQFLDSLRP